MGFCVLPPGVGRGVSLLCLGVTVAVVLGLADDRLRGGIVLLFSILTGTSSSLEDEGLGLLVNRGAFSSFFLEFVVESSVLFCFDGDFGGAEAVLVAGVSEVDDSESELLEPDPDVVDDVPLLLESDEDPELLSVLLLLTCKQYFYNTFDYIHLTYLSIQLFK